MVYDLNGLTADIWDQPPTSDSTLSKRWTTLDTRSSGPPYAAAAREQH